MDQPQQPQQRPMRVTNITVAPQIAHASAGPGPMRTGSSTPTAPAGPHINWGGVIKGAAIVTAVAVVAVVGFALFSAGAGALMTTGAGGAIQAAAGSFAGAIDIIAGVGQVAWHGLLSLGTGIASGFSSGFAAIAPGAAAAAPVATVSTGAITNTAGALGMGAGAMAALPMAKQHLANIHLFDPSQAAPGVTESAMTAKKSVVIHQHQAPQPDMATMPDPTDSMLDESLQASSKALKVAHHAAEDGHHYQLHQQDQRRHAARDLLQRSAEANKSWAERFGAAPAQRPTIGPRPNQSYTQQIAAEQAQPHELDR